MTAASRSSRKCWVANRFRKHRLNMPKSSMLECARQSNLLDTSREQSCREKTLSEGEHMKLWSQIVSGSLVLALALGVCVSPAAAASKKKKKEEKNKEERH